VSRPDELSQLLFADLALLHGRADVHQVAAALLKYWSKRDRGDVSLVQELAPIAGLTEDDLAALTSEVDRLLGTSHGDGRLVLSRTAVITHELHSAITQADQHASRHGTDRGAGMGIRLRLVAPDRYLDFRPIGDGGMGIVYAALDSELGRQVAFKVVRAPEDAQGAGVTPPAPAHLRAPEAATPGADVFAESSARFLQEAWVTGGMEHPGIAPVYELGLTEGGVPYYTMRFVPGGRTLATAIEERRGRSLEDRLALLDPFLKVCETVAYAHSRGVVHRDLKPANVALGDYGEVIVLDWGLAKLAGRPDDGAPAWHRQVAAFRGETEMRTVAAALGTPGYMAPEAAARHVDRVDAFSDIYSLGVILFEILTGRLPIEFATFDEYARHVQGMDAPDARSLEPGIAPALARLCASALAREPGDRPARVTDLVGGVVAWQRQRVADREIEILLAEAGEAVGETAGLSVLAMRRQAERAAAACRRVLRLRPGDLRATARLEEARRLGRTSHEIEARQAHRKTLRRAALAALGLVAVLAVVVASLLEARRREAEDARELARTERDHATLHRIRAEDAMAFVTSELREALEPEGRLDILARIGEKARSHFASVPVAEESPTTLRQRMRALGQLGEVYLAQGHLPKARTVFEEALGIARECPNGNEWAALAAFLRDRALVDVARIDAAQGYPRRGAAQIAEVVARFDRERPIGIDQRTWVRARILALNALTRARHARSQNARALASSRQAYDLALAFRADVSADLASLKLLTETGLLMAGSRLAAGDGEGGRLLAREMRKAVLALREQHPKDLTVEALGVQAALRVASLDLQTRDYEQARTMLRVALPRARRLVALRPENHGWRALLMRLLFLTGDAEAGPEQAMWKESEVYAEAYELAESLHERDPSNTAWVWTLINLCDRRTLALGPDRFKDTVARLTFRAQAAGFARTLSALEPDNPRWRYLLAFTLGTQATLTSDQEARLQLQAEAREHMRFALEHMPDAQDVNDFYYVLAYSWMNDAPEATVRRGIIRDTFDDFLRIARKNPNAYWVQHYLARTAPQLAQRRDPGRARLEPEIRREVRAARAWFEELRRGVQPPPARIAAALDAWIDALERAAQDPGK